MSEDKVVTTTKEKVLRTAEEGCSDIEWALKSLFPEVFEKNEKDENEIILSDRDSFEMKDENAFDTYYFRISFSEVFPNRFHVIETEDLECYTGTLIQTKEKRMVSRGELIKACDEMRKYFDVKLDMDTFEKN